MSFYKISYTQELQITTDFKKDVNGCLGLREKYFAKIDSIETTLKDKTRDEIISLLGEPNAYWSKSIFNNNYEKQKWVKFEYIISCKKEAGKVYKISIGFRKTKRGQFKGMGYYMIEK